MSQIINPQKLTQIVMCPRPNQFRRSNMMKKMWLYLLAALAMFILPSVALAGSIVVSVGNTAPTNPFDGGAAFVNGGTYGALAVFDAGNLAPPFFTGMCGGDELGATPSNCDKSWTFVYVIPAGETITSASLTVALWDLDPVQAGNQVALYQVDGGDVLTSAINTAAEALSGNEGFTGHYNVFTFSLTNFASLSGGSATVHLTFQGPGGTLFDSTQFNSGAILSSTLNITTQPSSSTVPEPGTWVLLASGIGMLAGGRRFLVRHL